MSKVMNEFDLDIEWSTPTGVEEHQRYLKTVLKRKLRLNNKVSILRQYSKTDLDKQKQTNAIIPNIIHSLVANHLMKVIINFAQMIEKSLITVHDCFGTHPNNSNILREIVKCEFAELYSDGEFINNFHEKNLRRLMEAGYPVTFDQEYKIFFVQNGKKRIIIPNPPSIGGFDINLVKDSVYMIN
uniref:DNA-directed RNA polymerase n=1 Tax=Ganoderma tsugae TaxID=2075311 RepID=A0A2S1WB95_GANTS|nr:DNA-directed RNA polymerase [Ganoderma tsugae]AWJ63856.1 DNA-directed RNA polymerase [Ganoderma tsugae]